MGKQDGLATSAGNTDGKYAKKALSGFAKRLSFVNNM
jgi:hypothetical protein